MVELGMTEQTTPRQEYLRSLLTSLALQNTLALAFLIITLDPALVESFSDSKNVILPIGATALLIITLCALWLRNR